MFFFLLWTSVFDRVVPKCLRNEIKTFFQKSKTQFIYACIYFFWMPLTNWEEKPRLFGGENLKTICFFKNQKYIYVCMCIVFFKCLWPIEKKTLGFLGEWMGRTASFTWWCTPLTFAKRNKLFSKIKNKFIHVCVFFFKLLWPIVKKTLGFLGAKTWKQFVFSKIKNIFMYACVLFFLNVFDQL